MKPIDLDVMIDQMKSLMEYAEPGLVPAYSASIDVLANAKTSEAKTEERKPRGRCLVRTPFMPDDWHDWVVIAKDVCVGQGKRVNIMECKSCGKLKIV